MGKNMKNKFMSTIVVLTMILAGFMVINTNMGIIETAEGARLVEDQGSYTGGAYILSNDGMGAQSANLTCGELITLYINNNSLDPDEDYTVYFYNGSEWKELDVDGDDAADEYGDLEISFHVPGWTDVGNSSTPKNPITNKGNTSLSNGEYNITLYTDGTSGTRVFSTMNITIHIGNLYDVRYKYDGEFIDNIIYNTSYSSFGFYVYNWTGSQWELEDDDDFDITVYKSDGSTPEVQTNSPTGTGYWVPDFAIDENDIGFSTHGYEVAYWVNVTQNVSGTANTARRSNVTLPVLLNMTADTPSDAEWGDTLDIDGYVLDGLSEAVEAGYTVRLYAPCDGGYTVAYEASTYSTGRYSMSVETGTGQGYAAGTWYVGTYKSGSAQRMQVGTLAPYETNFIPYAAFMLNTKDDAKVDVENTDDIIVDFNQTINVSVYNSSWMDNDEYKNMQIHVTGLAAWNVSSSAEYSEDDIVLVDYTRTGFDDDYAWYEFLYRFNDTGTATIIATWPGNGTSISGEDVGEGVDSSYSDTYGNASSGMTYNISGTTTFTVAPADDMNLIIDGTMVESVTVNSGGCSNGYINGSQWFNLKVFGDAENVPMNATIEITGCGLDIKIDEDDPTSSEYCSHHNWTNDVLSLYRINIAPKTAGTLTITVTNETEETSVSRDYTITGLTGSVTTSDGDDLGITVGTTETVTVTVTNGQYSTVYLTYFDYQWSNCNSLNRTTGDGTEGEGLNGIFTFVPDVDDLEHVGYIVVAATAGSGNWMYDVIEVEPIYDLTIEVVTPSMANATPSLTVGLEQDVVVKLLDSNGDEVDTDSPTVVGKLIDADHDEDNPLQTFTFSSSGSNWEYDDLRPYWKGQMVITGTNDTGETEHSGNITIDVEMATITYSPTAYTAGIGTDNVTLTVTGVDANGDPLPDNTRLYFHVNESNTFSWNTNSYCNLDEDGIGEIDIDEIGDNQTHINATFTSSVPNQGNRTLGKLDILFPTFMLDPDTIYIGQSNLVEITAMDHEDNPIEGINLTFVSSIPGILSAQPDPVQTNADGIVEISVNPLASGKLNVTIARNLQYENGQLNWTNAVVTDTVVTATSIKQMRISVSKSPIYEGETLTVTVTSGTNSLSGADVEFGETTSQTDNNGQATFTVPDPGVESAVYTITAEKAGYNTAEKSITVIKIWDITIIAPSKAPAAGEEFTITILAKGSPLAGATIEFNDKTYTSGADGKLTITAPSEAGDYTVKASYEDYTDATVTITIKEGGGVPGFELLTLVAALGVAFILIRRRR